MIDYAARRFREEVAQWPDGTYEADAYVDHDPLGNPDIHLHVKVTVAGDSLTIDFTGSDTRPEIQAWSTYGNTRGYMVGQLAVDDGPGDPEERGLLRVDRADRAEGLRAQPAAGQAGLGAAPTIPGVEVGEAIAVAMQHVLPERACRRSTRSACRRSSSASTRAPVRAFIDHSVDVYAGLVQRVEGHGRLGRAERRRSAT